MLNATVYVLILALGSAVVKGQFVNNYDEDARIECPNNQIFSFIGSMHDNRFEDRRWQFQCRPAPGVTTGCHWSICIQLDRKCRQDNPADVEAEVQALIFENSLEDDAVIYTDGSVVRGVRSSWAFTAQAGWKTVKEDSGAFALTTCSLTPDYGSHDSYVNEYDDPLIFVCPANEVLNGMMSIHNSQHEDRRFMMQCCNVPGISTENCNFTGFVHEYDKEMNFVVPSGQAIKGAFSVHDNDKEDRRWRFYVCDL